MVRPLGSEECKVINIIFTLVSHLSARTPPWSRLWLRGWFCKLDKALFDGGRLLAKYELSVWGD